MDQMKKIKFCYICKKSSNLNTLMMKTIVKLKSNAITLVNTEVLHIAHVIKNIIDLKKLW